MQEDYEEFISLTLRTWKFKETIKNAKRKLETPMVPASPCKTCKKNEHGETRSKTNGFKSKLACFLEASESIRLRMEGSIPKYHEDHIAGKGDISLQHYNLVHKCIPMPQAMKISAAKAAVDKEWEKLEKIPAWDKTKVRNKSEVIDKARTSGATVHFASLMDICHLKNAELEAKHRKYKGRVVLRGDIVKDDSGSYAVFTEQVSSASQLTAAKVMVSCPDCQGAQDVNTIPPIQQNIREKCLRETSEMNYSITTRKNWNDAYNNKQDHKHNNVNTNDDVDTLHFDDRVAHHNMH